MGVKKHDIAKALREAALKIEEKDNGEVSFHRLGENVVVVVQINIHGPNLLDLKEHTHG